MWLSIETRVHVSRGQTVWSVCRDSHWWCHLGYLRSQGHLRLDFSCCSSGCLRRFWHINFVKLRCTPDVINMTGKNTFIYSQIVDKIKIFTMWWFYEPFLLLSFMAINHRNLTECYQFEQGGVSITPGPFLYKSLHNFDFKKYFIK